MTDEVLSRPGDGLRLLAREVGSAGFCDNGFDAWRARALDVLLSASPPLTLWASEFDYATREFASAARHRRRLDFDSAMRQAVVVLAGAATALDRRLHHSPVPSTREAQ
jgi:hypothetical protein